MLHLVWNIQAQKGTVCCILYGIYKLDVRRLHKYLVWNIQLKVQCLHKSIVATLSA